MKVLVLSDSHHYVVNLEEILQNERSSELIVHCGDGADDMTVLYEYTENKALFLCKGNCDAFELNISENQLVPIGNTYAFACHGHKHGVKSGIQNLYYAAKEHQASICLFGHTHTPFYEEYDGIHFFNPGSVRNGEYGIIEYDGNRLTFTHKKLEL